MTPTASVPAPAVPDAPDPTATARLLPPPDAPPGLAAHLRRHGPLPQCSAEQLLDQVALSGLTGRGGGAFPVHRKLLAVAAGRRPAVAAWRRAAVPAGRRPVVIANGAEGEPASRKDHALLSRAPHLVLDGLQAAATAVGAGRAVAYVRTDVAAVVRQALVERAAAGRDSVAVEVVEAPPGFVSGHESAVVRAVDGGPALPVSTPPRVSEKGVGGLPTLVQNVETLAHLALVARYGAPWFRRLGTPAEPGTMLCTVSGPTGGPVVVEVPLGTPLVQVLAAGGQPADRLRAVLVGGYHGAWVTGPELAGLHLSVAELAPVGAVPGAGVLVTLDDSRCPLALTARIVRYLAEASARQCGPCLNGLPALADTLAALSGPSRTPLVPDRLRSLTGLVDGRGACAHPDGTVRLVRSVLAAFPGEVDAHAAGTCPAVRPQDGGAR